VCVVAAFLLVSQYWFTTEIHTFFEYRGNETFVFRGDDDVFVYINGHKEIDGGGVHTAANFEINMDQLKQGPLVLGEVYSLDMFHAERRVVQSNFKIQTSLTASCTVQNTPGMPAKNHCHVLQVLLLLLWYRLYC
jgi:fibro-slime domain-containing protein